MRNYEKKDVDKHQSYSIYIAMMDDTVTRKLPLYLIKHYACSENPYKSLGRGKPIPSLEIVEEILCRFR